MEKLLNTILEVASDLPSGDEVKFLRELNKLVEQLKKTKLPQSAAGGK